MRNVSPNQVSRWGAESLVGLIQVVSNSIYVRRELPTWPSVLVCDRSILGNFGKTTGRKSGKVLGDKTAHVLRLTFTPGFQRGEVRTRSHL
jgi:hypothetical protein